MGSRNQRVKPRSLSLAFYNANGLAWQRDEVRQYLTDHQVDILLVQETLLKPCNRDPRIANYNVIRNDREGRGGGTLVYYKRSLHCIPLEPPSLENLEVTICRLGMTGHQPINIASAYLPPSKRILQSDLQALFALGNSTILAGDFNSKHIQWNSHSSSPNGVILESLQDSLGFDVIAPMSPTHYSATVGHRPTVLDFALLKNVALRMRSIQVHTELSSDHRPVLIEFGLPTDSPTDEDTRRVTDWRKLKRVLAQTSTPELEQVPEQILTNDETDLAIDALTSHLQTAANNCSREVSTADLARRWELPAYLRELVSEKNAATRAHDSCPTEQNRSRMRYLQRQVKKHIKEFRDERWANFVGEIKPSHTAYWRVAKSLRSDQITQCPPLTRPDGTIAFDDDEKAECFADSLESQCSPSLEPTDDEHVQMVDSEVERILATPPTIPLEPTTVEEVQTIIRDLRSRKAPGADGITNSVLKLLPGPLIVLLVAIFNAALANCRFPDSWKDADVVGIPKPGKCLKNPASYRPISLLKCLGKVYERIIAIRLKKFVELRGLLIDEQFGFRPKHSAVHQVHRITEHVLSNFQTGRHTGALFFDVAKAFDKVWHNGLIYKLHQMEVPDSLVHILRDYLSNRSLRVRVHGTLSRPHPIRAGVPQGSVLGPILYTLYTNDVPKTPFVELALFADDTALYTSERAKSNISDRLQRAANALGEWFRRWRIEVNPEKSAAVFFSRDPRGLTRPDSQHRTVSPISLFGRPIPWVEKAKYLGVILDSRMTFGPHITAVRNKAAFYLGRLGPIFRNRRMSLRNKCTLYKACIRPVLTYASVVFAHAARSHLAKLQIIQNRFARNATAAPHYLRVADLHLDLELPSIISFMKKASRRYFETASQHPNPLIARAVNYTPRIDARGFRRRPRNSLFDPDDRITVANAPYLSPSNPNTPDTHRARRLRARRVRTSARYTRYR